MFDFLNDIRQNLQVPWRRGLFEAGIGMMQGKDTQGALDGFNHGLLAARQKPSTGVDGSSGWQGLLGNALQQYTAQQAQKQSDLEQVMKKHRERFGELMSLPTSLENISGPKPGLPVRRSTLGLLNNRFP